MPNIAAFIPHGGSQERQLSINRYFENYARQLLNCLVYWGDAQTFAGELRLNLLI